MTSESGWLLEVAVAGVNLYFGGSGCDVSANSAIRFCRRQDAVTMLATLEHFHVVAKGCYIVSEHMWAEQDANT